MEFIKSMPAGKLLRHLCRIYSSDRSALGSRDQPSILFSHIPLSHPDTISCGPLREYGTLRRGVGVGYQNTLDKQTTEFLLENLRPLAVFRWVGSYLASYLLDDISCASQRGRP